jgi:hypothetical protein
MKQKSTLDEKKKRVTLSREKLIGLLDCAYVDWSRARKHHRRKKNDACVAACNENMEFLEHAIRGLYRKYEIIFRK